MTAPLPILCYMISGQTWLPDGQLAQMPTPVLNVHRKEMTLKPGANITVRCLGTSQLTWFYPNNQVNINILS